MKLQTLLLALVFLLAAVVGVTAALADVPFIFHAVIGMGVGIIAAAILWILPKFLSR